MFRKNRTLAVAAIVSVLLHGFGLISVPRFDLYSADAEEISPPVEARIVTRTQSPIAKAPPALAPKATQQRHTTAKKRLAQAHAAPKAAPHWIALPDDLGAVPPMPDGGLGDAVAQSSPAGPSDAAGSESAAGNGNSAAAATNDGGGAAEYPVRRARLVYDLLYAGGQVGTLTHTWATDGHVYRVESVAEGAGLVKLFYGGKFIQRSSGRLGASGLIPSEYTLQRGSAARSESARFDWGAGKLSLAWKNERQIVDLPTGAQDALSIIHQAYFMPPTAPAAPLEVATSRKIAHYIYELVGETLIETPIGILRTVHIRRADDDGMRIEVWLDLDRSLLPARILGQDHRGFAFEQIIREAAIEA
ncbi:MAG: DUF3108 domain-containing protein [Burkholderiales bacterium]